MQENSGRYFDINRFYELIAVTIFIRRPQLVKESFRNAGKKPKQLSAEGMTDRKVDTFARKKPG